jgi:hypothetical protein
MILRKKIGITSLNSINQLIVMETGCFLMKFIIEITSDFKDITSYKIDIFTGVPRHSVMSVLCI